jgi:hypothetical protein
MSEGHTCNGHEFCTGLTPKLTGAVRRPVQCLVGRPLFLFNCPVYLILWDR